MPKNKNKETLIEKKEEEEYRSFVFDIMFGMKECPPEFKTIDGNTTIMGIPTLEWYRKNIKNKSNLS